jgi:hypothetical protein
MARRSLSTPLLLLALLLALLPVRAAAAELQVTIGFLPLATRSAEILLRGSAPANAIVAVSVNGELKARVQAASSMAVYRVMIPLEPGRNEITAQLEGTQAWATATLYRVTAAFPDLEGDPLRDDIEILATLGLVSGDPAGNFRPGDPLTRAELAKLMVLALGLQPADEQAPLPLADADAIPAWARPYVATAYAQGLMRGYADGTFRPNEVVTRAELVAMAVRAVPAGSPARRSDAPPFTDQAAMPDWVRPAAEQAVRLGLIDSFWGDAFRAGDRVTRREAAAVIRRLIDLHADLTR